MTVVLASLKDFSLDTVKRVAWDREPAPALRGFLAGVRKRFPPVDSPRDLGSDAQRLADTFGAAVLGRLADFDLA
jgi:hypothetical protein